MDSTLSAIMKETMYKEQRFARKWKDEEEAAAARDVSPAVAAATLSLSPGPKHASCQVAQLEQTLGMQRNPHPHGSGKYKKDADPQHILRYGVSAEGQGKAGYLLFRTRGGGPAERFG